MSDYQGEKFKTFISKVKANHKEYGFEDRTTNEVLAEKLGVSSVQLNRYYKSKSLERESVNKITSAFNVSEEEIWGNPEGALREPTIEYGHPERKLNPVVDYRDELLKALLKNQELQNEVDRLREELNNIKSLHQRNGTA